MAVSLIPCQISFQMNKHSIECSRASAFVMCGKSLTVCLAAYELAIQVPGKFCIAVPDVSKQV